MPRDGTDTAKAAGAIAAARDIMQGDVGNFSALPVAVAAAISEVRHWLDIATLAVADGEAAAALMSHGDDDSHIPPRYEDDDIVVIPAFRRTTTLRVEDDGAGAPRLVPIRRARRPGVES